MANQITIDIVAQTQKLTSGINDANTQIDGMSSKLKGAAAAAGAAASAFVLKQGVTFLKQGIENKARELGILGNGYDSGSEQITSFVTASNSPTPDKDIIQETYKRLYHNLPYLIKTKGTERGLRALINCFGIPSGSLEIKELSIVYCKNK